MLLINTVMAIGAIFMLMVLVGQFIPNRRTIDVDHGREGNLDDDI